MANKVVLQHPREEALQGLPKKEEYGRKKRRTGEDPRRVFVVEDAQVPPEVLLERIQAPFPSKVHFADFPLPSALSALPSKERASDYFISNESNSDILLKIPKREVMQPDTIHIGFACGINFDLIARRKPSKALICDVDPKMFKSYSIIKKALSLAKTREKFIELVLSDEDIQEAMGIVDTPKDQWKDGFFSSRFYELLESPTSWLSSDESFQFVKGFFQEERCRFLDVNILNSEKMGQIADWAKESDLRIDSVYFSNINEWLSRAELRVYSSNCRRLISANTFVVDARYPTRKKPGLGPPLRLSRGEMLDLKKL